MADRLTEFEIKEKLGQGSFGVVYRVVRKKDREVYVLKQIDFSRMGRRQKQEALKEAQLMNKLENTYIVRFYDSFQARNKLNIVMEHCENRDLGQYLKRQMGKHLREAHIWRFFIEMCLGLQYLHANRILHRDIKTINMFLAKDDKIKIGDLGVARELN